MVPGGRVIVKVLVERASYTEMFRGPGDHLFSNPGSVDFFAGWKVLDLDTSRLEAPGNTCERPMKFNSKRQ